MLALLERQHLTIRLIEIANELIEPIAAEHRAMLESEALHLESKLYV
ncbi:hypothetical protein [Vibrio splendidus]|nr:hypothetical protein [Vibrio splendidus]